MHSLGFGNNVRTQDAIATVVSHITRGGAFRKKHSAALVLIDVEKAFEMVSPTVVLQVLAKAGIVGSLLNWINNFLTEMRRRVQYAAAYIVNNNSSYHRLNDDATITQAELMAIWGALEHAAANQKQSNYTHRFFDCHLNPNPKQRK